MIHRSTCVLLSRDCPCGADGVDSPIIQLINTPLAISTFSSGLRVVTEHVECCHTFIESYNAYPQKLASSYHRKYDSMADYNYGGSDEENAELKKLNTEVVRAITFNKSLKNTDIRYSLRIPIISTTGRN